MSNLYIFKINKGETYLNANLISPNNYSFNPLIKHKQSILKGMAKSKSWSRNKGLASTYTK